VVNEVERLAGRLGELAATGVDVTGLGNGPRPSGLRRVDAAGGWFFLPVALRSHLVSVVRIMPPFEDA
jgi:hypothetical protein